MKTKTLKITTTLLLLVSLWSHMLFVPVAYAQEATEATTATVESSSTSDATQTSSSESTASTASETDATNSTTATSEEHDDLALHITQTGASELPTSDSTISEMVSDIASTSQSEFLGVDLASTTPDTNTIDTNSTEEHGASASTSCAAVTDNESTSEATSSSDSSTPTIRSGSATVLANILNLLNTTFVNSPGGILFSNFTDTAPTIDLRDASLLTSCEDSACSGQEGLEVNVVGNASIDNEILLDAMSGQNTVSHPEGQGPTTSTIESGDAIAGLNLVNIANTTFVNSQYLIVTLNAFHGVDGDIVFPSLLNFFSSAGNSALEGGSSITNAATVANDVTAAADSGSNTTDGSDMSVISTGSADAHTNVFNQINSVLPNSQVSILFRISGTWNGQVFGAPSNVSQVRGPDGSLYLFGDPESGSSNAGEATLLHSTTTADINNHVQLGALSGQNSIENASTSIITTGDALASANIVNIANQNVIGRNWILAIIDIFGDFTGNIAFGRPDLWIGDQVETPGVVQNGSELTYKITVINNGDSPASNVVVTDLPDFAHIDIFDMSLTNDPCVTGKLSWNIGKLLPGAAYEITYRAHVKNSSAGDRITNTSNVTGLETDNNGADNSDTTTVQLTVINSGGGSSCCSYPTGPAQSNLTGGGSGMLATSTLSVTRLTNDVTLDGTSTVAQSIVVKNTSNHAVHDVVFHDYLRDPTTHLVHEERWNLDTVAPHEEITIQYSIVFDDGAMGGTYRLSTLLDGKNYPSTIVGNGTILLVATPQFLSLSNAITPKVHIISRGVQDGPILVMATSTLPGIPQTAAAGAIDSGVSIRFEYLILFLLLFAASYGALRILSDDGKRKRTMRPLV